MPVDDATFLTVWSNADDTFTSRHISKADIIEDTRRCAATCPCWRHRILRILDERVIHAEHRFGRSVNA